MIAVKAVPSAINLTLGVDTVLPVTKETAIRMLGKGIAFRVGYLDTLTAAELGDIVSVGMLVSFVSFALEFDPSHTLARLAALGVPAGCTVWLDVEGSGLVDTDIVAKANAWAAAVQGEGYEAGLYVGAGCPLTSTQLSALLVTRYWHSCSWALEPSRGYCMRQLRPDDVMVCGVKVDVCEVEPDYRGDLPTFCSA
jgi:hypothetical protein